MVSPDSLNFRGTLRDLIFWALGPGAFRSEVPQNADSAKQKRRRQSEAPDPKVSKGPQKRAPSAKSDPSSNGKASAKSGAKKQKK